MLKMIARSEGPIRIRVGPSGLIGLLGMRNPDLTVGAIALRASRLHLLRSEWFPWRIFLSYFVGVILILAGVCLLVNKKARTAASSLGLTILLTMLPQASRLLM